MKIRYYLRGLGLGILVTAIFFMVSDNSSETMSDEMIKERARQLGMTESVVLAEISTEEETPSGTLEVEKEETVEETAIGETIIEVSDIEETTIEESDTEETTIEESVIDESVMEETHIEEAMTEESIVEKEDTSIEETVEEEALKPGKEQEAGIEEETETEENVGTNTEVISIVVNRGDGSDTVSRHMQEAGLVADAYEYDRYLMANGYDKRIGAGEHQIPADATWEEMARILCNMQ